MLRLLRILLKPFASQQNTAAVVKKSPLKPLLDRQQIVYPGKNIASTSLGLFKAVAKAPMMAATDVQAKSVKKPQEINISLYLPFLRKFSIDENAKVERCSIPADTTFVAFNKNPFHGRLKPLFPLSTAKDPAVLGKFILHAEEKQLKVGEVTTSEKTEVIKVTSNKQTIYLIDDINQYGKKILRSGKQLHPRVPISAAQDARFTPEDDRYQTRRYR